MGIYTELFVTFSKIGGFTLGGGYAMVPLMEKEVVERKSWLNKEEFMDILAVAQATPGLFAMNMASHIGYKLRGTLGGIVGSLSVALPSIVAILLIAMFFQAFRDNIYVEKIFRGIRPAVVALIAAPCFSMARTSNLTLGNIWIPIVSALLICSFGVSPVLIILAAGIGGYIYGRIHKRQNRKTTDKR